ncbi:MAG: hypothetical protein OHK93_004223 [Ramalina farinacea]|uniref:ATPase AAA-type core domain-containing protein n=1 Tax=Ramalina farinacea TaxID=258253 RepID=A0AA43QIM6_9LECA|nr:hypothetical protein [Ramalina farinacea]
MDRRVLPLFMPKARPDLVSYCCRGRPQESLLDHHGLFHELSLQNIAWATQNGLDVHCIERYLEAFDKQNVAETLEEPYLVKDEAKNILKIPILAMAVEQNSPELIRLLCSFGACPNDTIKPCEIPVLAYAVINSEYGFTDTTDVLIQLLMMGADPHQIPLDMWQDPLKAPRRDVPRNKASTSEWCTAEVREALARTLNLMQRYVLLKASTIDRPSARTLQIARATKIMALFEIPYHIIGQQEATRTVVDAIVNVYMSDRNKPLVLLLTGLSGHGKTELAKNLGAFLSLRSVSVDCARMQNETDVFGPQAPYKEYDKGSPLNNHLCEHAGQRSLVFLDEFEKTTEDVHKAMLLLFEQGWYHDRREINKRVDCSKTIWILAANVGVETISRFWSRNSKAPMEQAQRTKEYLRLQRAVGREVMQELGHPLYGRISATVPFVPFNELEQAVATYEFMREFRNQKRRPIEVDFNRLLNHCWIDYMDDGQLCSHLASEHYRPEIGARSLEHAVEDNIIGPTGDCFLSGDGEVTDQMNEGPLERYEVRLVTEAGLQPEIKVTRAGVAQFQRSEEQRAARQQSEAD